MSNIFKNRRKDLLTLKKLRSEKIVGAVVDSEHKNIKKCPSCHNDYTRQMLKNNLYVCPNCGYHISIPAKERIRQLADEGTFVGQNGRMMAGNPISFPDYESKIDDARMKAGINDAVVTGTAQIGGQPAMLIVMDSRFMMASMGCVVGEKFSLAVEYAMKNELPVVAVCASGGARMQEGMFSLMQMAKTSAVLEKFSKEGGFYLAILTHPTMGGVSASFAMLGDIIIAEPGARIGFAGPRVIEQTIGQKLPKGFQSAEFMQEHGFVDMVVKRNDLKKVIADLIKLHSEVK